MGILFYTQAYIGKLVADATCGRAASRGKSSLLDYIG